MQTDIQEDTQNYFYNPPADTLQVLRVKNVHLCEIHIIRNTMCTFYYIHHYGRKYNEAFT